MEKMINILGSSYTVIGFVVVIVTYYYIIQQYKYTKEYYNHQCKKNKRTFSIKKMEASDTIIKSNMTQYIDSFEIDRQINCPVLIFFLGNRKTKSIKLTREKTFIGRSKTDDIIINNSYISRSHCYITKVNDKYYINIGMAQNPILLNGQKIVTDTEEIFDGDIINMKNANISFEFKLLQEKNTI